VRKRRSRGGEKEEERRKKAIKNWGIGGGRKELQQKRHDEKRGKYARRGDYDQRRMN